MQYVEDRWNPDQYIASTFTTEIRINTLQVR